MSTTIQVPQISESQLRDIVCFSDAISLVESVYGAVALSSEVLGDGFTLVEKDKLLGEPFVLVDYTVHTSKTNFDENGEGLKFVTVRCVTKEDKRVAFNDGSTGVAQQLRDLAAREIYGGIYVQNGLRASEYEVLDAKGRKSSATTYYLS